ncbi:pyridoxamine 5'-phosphate oxidase family protein [Desulfosporosinus fructosivorans]|uniref:Pyridoxamine 5'-phosphate oxidase family protein n=1 Tax=Desulfosporosinus fructosivorans TaxID=2018669 RepID=A0A4Z0R779_9FIRM|nr:pyridoxamine 5'-phosphate oxidase family protein [Desulfosporosinus fructosivorans]TGE38404.1 pyridoxamine 5'-phosphate oxidase family protein [Desulfosporosinus fructosivorans]
MRRNDKEITEQKALDEIMKKAQVCRLGVSYESMAYIIPMSFGYADRVLYFHSGPEGLKLLILKENPKACFEVDIDTEVIPSEKGCNWSMRYQSVIGFGEVEFIEDIDGKRKALQIIMQQYGGDLKMVEDAGLSGITIFKLVVSSMTGKKSGY